MWQRHAWWWWWCYVYQRDDWWISISDPGWERIIKIIEKGEEKLEKLEQMREALALKIGRYKDPWTQLKIPYAPTTGKQYTVEEDQFLVRGSLDYAHAHGLTCLLCVPVVHDAQARLWPMG